MTQIRSYIFAAYVPIVTLLLGLLLSPLMLHKVTTRMVVKSWARCVMGGLRVICGINYTIHGAQHLPDTPCLVAARHESMWETVALLLFFKNPIFILKQELVSIPLFGWWCRAQGFIPIDRNAGPRAMRKIINRARLKAKDGAQIIIFPEGTRMAPGILCHYQPGVAGLYRALALPCVPLVHNSGQYWRYPSMERRSGTISVKVLPAIQPGLSRPAFMTRLADTMHESYQSLTPRAVPPPQQQKQKNPYHTPQWPLIFSLGLGLTLFLAYSLLWYIGAKRMQSEVTAFIHAQHQQNTRISHTDFHVTGYPFFLRGVLTGVTIEKKGAFSYNTPQIYIETTPFSLGEMRLFPSSKQSIAIPGQEDWQITSAQTLLSLEDNELRISLQGVEAIHSGEAPRRILLDRLLANATLLRATDQTLHAQFALQSENIQVTYPQEPVKPSIYFPLTEMAGSVSQIATFLPPTSQDYVANLRIWRDVDGQITLNRFRLFVNDAAHREGAFVASTNGHLKIDPAGFLEGEINLRVENISKLATLLTMQKILTQDQVTRLEPGIALITAIAGDDTQLPLVMQDGHVYMGPLRIMALPNILHTTDEKKEH